MGKYQNGLETRDKILEVCRELFYDPGYEKTTFKEISRMARTNQSAIHYHFKTKENIARIIYGESVAVNNGIVDKYTDDDTPFLVKMAFDLELYMYKLCKDKRYRDFYTVATSNWYAEENFIEDGIGRMSYDNFIIANAPESESEETALLKRMSCSGVDQVMLHYIDTHEDTIDYRSICRQTLSLYKRILEIPQKEFDEAIDELDRIEKLVDWDAIDTKL